ncbi:LPS export ABC transporter periplasmic protein LptC [Methylicorpusculum sp.]|uniref:LPS export ABC transporter periplasmic protein LptC n=1 Tax=Methylicorpusculum sp. TaxID=2713644 RepID=UPI0027310DE1|nr:LPS export ABC transporter periplasmic protein LptC [Methylicorpusculum sp.]MDP2179490.1 LPS export ABC transporter periplasmic protein LptC [Methylicorpusculum sp.]MDP3529743.1 LPS export ABC transporter periplasmic protein LptC [Methylicorpusculum sp.]MDZ4152356.1 LPS export ABC transporter periplasmic protein LptC [Methylicorpusculum sp.]
MPGNYKIYVYAVAFALISWWLLLLNETEQASLLSGADVHSPDYFSNGYTKWEMGTNGQLKNKLIADEMKHYSDDGTIHLTKPVMTLINKTTPPWVIESETAKVSGDGKLIFLNGKAVVKREGAQGVRPMKINSSNLRVKPEESYAETDEWAELLSPPNRTEGVGMQLNYGDPIRVKLFAKVRGKYEFKKK